MATARRELDAAVSGLRHAGQMDDLSRGLLTRAWLRFLTGACTGPESAQADLDEAWEIAELGPMKRLLAEIHLHRARLFSREQPYPWASRQADLAAARRLIERCRYWRRKEELEDAEATGPAPPITPRLDAACAHQLRCFHDSSLLQVWLGMDDRRAARPE